MISYDLVIAIYGFIIIGVSSFFGINYDSPSSSSSSSQFLGRCVANEDQSDCPIDWREMEIENGLKAGRMTKTAAVSPQRRCICDSLLAQKPDADSVYAADPEVDEKFMVCVRVDSVIHEGKCPAPLLWDDDAVACNTKSVRHPVPGCSSGSRTTAATKPVVTKPVVILPGGGGFRLFLSFLFLPLRSNW